MSNLPAADHDNMLRFTAARPEASASGFPCDHAYVELVYMPLMGPTAVALLRRLNLMFAHSPESTMQLDAAVLARGLGLRASDNELVGGRSTLMKAIQRLAKQGVVSQLDERHYRILLHLPPLSESDVRRLPPTARAIHRRYVESDS